MARSIALGCWGNNRWGRFLYHEWLNGRFSFSDGDIFEIGNGPFSRMKVLSIDRANRVATIQLCYSSSPKTTPKVKIRTASSDQCNPVLIEGAVTKFTLGIDGLKCSQGYSAMWTVVGASPVRRSTDEWVERSRFTCPIRPSAVTVSVTVTLDDGSTSRFFPLQPIFLAKLSLREFICKLLSERLKRSVVGWEPERYGESRRLSGGVGQAARALRVVCDY